MKLIDRQIKAVEETLEQFKIEYEAGEDYHDQDACALCKYFSDKSLSDCGDCPLKLLIDKERACVTFMGFEKVDTHGEDFEDIAGFLQSLLISLEKMT